MRLKTALLGGLALASPLAPIAFAQEPSSPAPARTDSTQLEEIVVTARRVEERLQDVPLSVKAFSGDNLQKSNINSIDQLANLTPGLQYSPDFGRVSERPVIRGISALRPEAPQPVSVFRDGVYIRDGVLGLLLDDAQRVEVVKGPQSALYGRSTYAGAINYASVKPGNDWTGRITLMSADHDTREIFGAVTVPLIDDVLSVRLGGKYYTYGGEYTNVATGNKIGQEESSQVQATVLFKPTQNLELIGFVSRREDDDGHFAVTVRTVPTLSPTGAFISQNGSSNVPNGGLCNGQRLNILGGFNAVTRAFNPADAATLNNGWPCGPASAPANGLVRRNETDFQGWIDPRTGKDYGDAGGLYRITESRSLTANLDVLNGHTVSYIGAITQQWTILGQDQSYSGVRFAPTRTPWSTINDDKLQYFTHELKLSSPQDQTLTWLVGASTYNERTSGLASNVVRFDPLLTLAQNNSVPFSQLQRDPTRAVATTEIESRAYFGRVQFTGIPRVKLSAETRYFEDDVTVGGTVVGTAVASVGGFTAGQPVFFRCPGTTTPGCTVTFDGWAPRFTADFKLTDDAMLYAQWAKGFKAGGFNTSPGLSAPEIPFEGEEITAYEAGIKSEWFDRRLRANLAVFKNDVSGLQLSNLAVITSPTTGLTSTVTVINNVGEAETQGAEIELSARLLSWLTVSGNYAYTEAEAIKGTETNNGQAFGGNLSVAGKTLPRSPRDSAAVSIDVDYPIGAGDYRLFGRVDYTYQSRRFAEIQNLIWAAPVTRINLNAGVETERLRLGVFVRNATDELASLNGFRYLDPNTFRRTAADFLPRGRQVGATISAKF
jgi:outer membrane receptor protein involved in Fe transport